METPIVGLYRVEGYQFRVRGLLGQGLGFRVKGLRFGQGIGPV